MSNFDDAWSPFNGPMRRRSVLRLLGTSAIAIAGSATPALHALAQSRPDDPVDCAPPGIAGKAAITFAPIPHLPIRTRKSVFELTKTEVDRLKAAYAALRKLTVQFPDDPRGWLRQGLIHCWYSGGGSNGRAAPDIHGSWLFLPWHRAFLYFHERILCKLLNDDTFALPYWDWDSQGRQTFPTIYGDPNNESNPLYDVLRSARPGSRIPAGVVSARSMNPTMNAPTNELFMGSRNESSGAIENQPNGPVHVWTADTTMRGSRNDMGVLTTSAQDPVFFSHHGNIDRLWSVWLGLSPHHQNFPDQAWLSHGWEFYDENSVWTRIAVSDVIDPVNSLRCDYQPPSPRPIWSFTQRPPPNVTAVPEPALTVENAPATTAFGPAPVTQSITVPPRVATAFAGLTAEAAPQYVLHIDGVQVPPTTYTRFRIYLNLPDATAKTGVDVPNFVGERTVLARYNKAQGSVRPNKNFRFDITAALAEVAKPRAGSLTVTLVPTAAEGWAPVSSSFENIYIDQNL